MTAVVVGTFSALAAPANAALTAVGPTDPGSLYPSYYKDDRGIALQLCQDGLPLCLAGPKLIQDVHAAGGDAEAFYFHASAEGVGEKTDGTGGFLIESALEAAYLGAGDGQEQTFQRRQASATGVTPGGTYTITDPYGTYTCKADSAGRVQPGGAGLCRFETTPVPGNFTNALSGPIGPFLTWDTYGSPTGAPPAGYIGDGGTPHKVVGSPNGFDKMRVSGPGIVGTCTDADGTTTNNCDETNLIIIQGKVQPGPSAAVSASNWDFGNIGALATKVFTYKNTSSDTTSVNITSVAKSAGTSTDYTLGGTCAAGALAPGDSCTVSVTYTPTGTSPDDGSVVISSDTPGIGDRTIALTGKSVGVPFINAPATGGLAFGRVGTGTTSAEDVVVIGNSGVGNLSLTSATLTGTSASHFTRVGTTNTCATLAPDAGCEVGVRFAPTTNGDKTANLRLLFNDGTTLNVPLAGTGAAPTVPGAPASVTGTTAQGSATVNWTAPTVTGSSTITGYTVKVLNGATQVATRSLGSSARTATFTGLAANTTYTIEVVAVNGSGPGTAGTATVTTPAVVDPVPTVTARTPSGTGVAATSNVTATFSENVQGVSGTTFFLRAAGSATNIPATVTYNTTTRVATLDPTANLTAGTQYTASLTGGATAIRDAANQGVANTTWTFTTAAAPTDTTRPTVTARQPAVNATSVALAANVTATFSEAVSNVSGTTFTLRNVATNAAVAATVSYNSTTRVATLNPTANLAADTRYTATLTSGIQDAATTPNALAQVTWSFSTGTAPTVTGKTPAANATGVSRTANVTATFSEAVKGVNGTTVTLKNPAGATVTAVVSYNATTRVVTLNPSVTLAANSKFTVNITGGASGITDNGANPLANVTWSFTTGA